MTKHKTPWLLVGEKTVPFDDDNWELYDTSKDWSQANDLAKQMPEKLHALQRIEGGPFVSCQATFGGTAR